jgi:uncharacterized protein involved in exopolysaccharide biosynthesis
MNKDLPRLAGGGLILAGVLLLALGGGLLLSSNSYDAIVRLKVEKELPDVSSNRTTGFDPYWLQYQFEMLQSKSLLYRVITNLDLARTWGGKQNKGETLRIEAAYAQLKNESMCGKPVAQA